MTTAEAFGYRTMRLFFFGGLAVTAFLVPLSIVSPGPHPVRRFALVAIVLFCWLAVCCVASAAMDALRRSPALVLASGSALVVVAAFDGGLHYSSLETDEYVLLGIALIAGGGRLLTAQAVLLSSGTLASLPVGYGSHRLFTEPVLGDLLALWGMTAVLAVFLYVWRTSHTHAVDRVTALRGGAPALTPALSAAILHAPLLLPTAIGSQYAPLSETELEVVQQLAAGLTPKQIAAYSHRSLHTIRAHIRSAKRKTGARTIAELVILADDLEKVRT